MLRIKGDNVKIKYAEVNKEEKRGIKIYKYQNKWKANEQLQCKMNHALGGLIDNE